MKSMAAKKTKENSPIKSASKRQTFNLQASLKKKSLGYKPYTGAFMPVASFTIPLWSVDT